MTDQSLNIFFGWKVDFIILVYYLFESGRHWVIKCQDQWFSNHNVWFMNFHVWSFEKLQYLFVVGRKFIEEDFVTHDGVAEIQLFDLNKS